jgi:hypothetical protein
VTLFRTGIGMSLHPFQFRVIGISMLGGPLDDKEFFLDKRPATPTSKVKRGERNKALLAGASVPRCPLRHQTTSVTTTSRRSQ